MVYLGYAAYGDPKESLLQLFGLCPSLLRLSFGRGALLADDGDFVHYRRTLFLI